LNSATLILILLALLAANLPWLSDRLFYLVPLRRQPKPFAWRLFELVALYFALGALAIAVERNVLGQVAPQHWEFYAITACMFLVFAFPGFIYRYLWRR
jgi:hypothetical protein